MQQCLWLLEELTSGQACSSCSAGRAARAHLLRLHASRRSKVVKELAGVAIWGNGGFNSFTIRLVTSGWRCNPPFLAVNVCSNVPTPTEPLCEF